VIQGLEPVALQELRALGAPRSWTVEGHLEAMPSLTPIRGQLTAEHRGNVLALEAELATIVTLTCDRCLGQFNQKLSCSPSELIWLGDAPPSEQEVETSEDVASMEGLMECLDPRGHFDPEQWVFEQLHLQRPVVNRCGEHCPGAPGLNQAQQDHERTVQDPRWEALRQLRNR